MTETDKAIQTGIMKTTETFGFGFEEGVETGGGKDEDGVDSPSVSFIELSGTDSILSSEVGLRDMLVKLLKKTGQVVVDGGKEGKALTATQKWDW